MVFQNVSSCSNLCRYFLTNTFFFKSFFQGVCDSCRKKRDRIGDELPVLDVTTTLEDTENPKETGITDPGEQ